MPASVKQYGASLSEPLLSSGQASPLFFSDLLEGFIDQHLFGQKLFQFGVLFFKFFEPFDFGNTHTAIGTFPLIKSLFTDIVLSDDLPLGICYLSLLQNLDDLLFAESFLIFSSSSIDIIV